VSQHLSELELLQYIEEALPERKRRRVEAHLAQCPTCRRRQRAMAQVQVSLSRTLVSTADATAVDADRSWARISQQWPAQIPSHTWPLFRLLTRHATAVAIVLLAIVGVAGAIHVLAVSNPTSRRPKTVQSPTLTTTSAHLSLPRPLPSVALGDSRISILVLGIDLEASASERIDMAMILCMDTNSRQGVILSLPTDLSLDIPGEGRRHVEEIMTATPGESMAQRLLLALDTVSDTLGVPIQYIVLAHPQALVTAIDAIGGIDVEVPAAIEDPKFPDDRGGFDPVYIQAGRQHLDGAAAIKYVRTRVVPQPSFDRGSRQRQLVLAVFDKVYQHQMLHNLIRRTPALWPAVSDDIETNLSMNEVIDIALSATTLTMADVHLADLDNCCTTQDISSGGLAVLVVEPEKVQELLHFALEKTD